MPDEMPLEIKHASNLPEIKLQSGENLRQHDKMHTCEQSFEPSGKEKTFSRKKIFLVSETAYTTDACNKQPVNVGESVQVKEKMLSNNPDFDNHQQTQSGEKSHEHFLSEKSLICKEDVKVNEITQTAKSCYICGYCKKPFNFKSCINSKHRGERGANLNVCNECKENIDWKSELTGDQILDTAEKPYECNEHGKAFHQQLSVIACQRIQTDGKPYECGECGKAFKLKSYLIAHQRIHTEVKPYEC
ncbi:zinc finger protein 182-like, partial [Ochotona curzoniae]|uniref:zinc finger protein 182-like n=1 Tax=Ochotona curzoniae TaxID=130825 RepID=UPI001B34B100